MELHKSTQKPLSIIVTGDLARFTMPGFYCNTYPVLTPNAARGILESVYWKPDMYYSIKKIINYKPVNIIVVGVNEYRKINRYNTPYRVSKEFLCDVEYEIEFEIVAKRLNDNDASVEDREKHHYNIFKRYIEEQHCRHRPFLGVKDCLANIVGFGPNNKPTVTFGCNNRELILLYSSFDFTTFKVKKCQYKGHAQKHIAPVKLETYLCKVVENNGEIIINEKNIMKA